MALSSWQDRAGISEQGLAHIIEHTGQIYSQLRANGGYGSGMTQERGKAIFHQYIEMRIDRAEELLTTREFVGLTLNTDIQVGDIIRVPNHLNELDLLTVTSLRWLGRVAKVELNYGG